jgi:hypothetical protein
VEVQTVPPAWPLRPARPLSWELRPGQQLQLSLQQRPQLLQLVHLRLHPGSHGWWPRWQPLQLVWLWTLMLGTQWVMPSLGTSEEVEMLSPLGLTSLTRSPREPSRCSSSLGTLAFMREKFLECAQNQGDFKLL